MAVRADKVALLDFCANAIPRHSAMYQEGNIRDLLTADMIELESDVVRASAISARLTVEENKKRFTHKRATTYPRVLALPRVFCAIFQVIPSRCRARAYLATRLNAIPTHAVSMKSLQRLALSAIPAAFHLVTYFIRRNLSHNRDGRIRTCVDLLRSEVPFRSATSPCDGSWRTRTSGAFQPSCFRNRCSSRCANDPEQPMSPEGIAPSLQGS